MPRWIDDRAKRIRDRNPEMSESQSWAIATQQAHKLGKTPKSYGTAEGRAQAAAKYTLPRKEYQKTAEAIPPTSTEGSVTAAQVPQLRPSASPSVKLPSVGGGVLPTAQTGPSKMLKVAGVRYAAFADEVCRILLTHTDEPNILS